MRFHALFARFGKVRGTALGGQTRPWFFCEAIAISLRNVEPSRWDFEKIVSKHVR